MPFSWKSLVVANGVEAVADGGAVVELKIFLIWGFRFIEFWFGERERALPGKNKKKEAFVFNYLWKGVFVFNQCAT